MSICDTCGNEISEKAMVCPYCDSKQIVAPVAHKVEAARVSVIRLKADNPTVNEAMTRLQVEIVSARKRNSHVIKFIHGYGSSGSGGAIKTALLNRLSALKNEGAIRTFITGEAHNEFAGSRNYLMNKYPELKETWIEDRGNPGITFVEL